MRPQKQNTPERQDMEMTPDVNNPNTGNGQDEKPREPPESETFSYSAGLKLGFIFVALCLTVFLVALVCVPTVPAGS